MAFAFNAPVIINLGSATVPVIQIKWRGSLRIINILENKSQLSLLVIIHHCTKIAFGLLKRPRAFGINTKAHTQSHHLFRCHLGLYRPKAGAVP